MFDKLLERDREESLRTTKRKLAFPDNTVREVEAYRLIWRWYDHLLAYEFAADADEILGYVMRTMQTQSVDESEALGLVVEYLVIGTEMQGGDLTDDNLPLLLAKQQMASWTASKSDPSV